jgi:hypothetical protein
MLRRWMGSLLQISVPMRKLGAYALVALVVPGGTLIALLMWGLQQRGWLTPRTGRALLAVVAFGTGLILPG